MILAPIRLEKKRCLRADVPRPYCELTVLNGTPQERVIVAVGSFILGLKQDDGLRGCVT